jgi:5-methylthioadenosine/S-adenosylhomocysteine deaminase
VDVGECPDELTTDHPAVTRRSDRDTLTIRNGIIVTLNDADDVFFGGTVQIEGNRITGVHPTDSVSGAGRVIDATDKIVMPGLVDFHYHTALSKGWAGSLPLRDYLQSWWYPMVRSLDAESAYWAALASYSESVKCGVTTVNDMYRHLDALADAAATIGIRAVLSNVVAGDSHGLDTLAENERVFRARNGSADGRVTVFVGIEWLPLASPGLLRDARSLADELGTGIHMHLSESMAAIEMSEQLFGRRPTQVAYDCGLLGPDCVAAHCLYLSDQDLKMLSETHTNVSHQPSSSAWGGAGVAQLPEMLAAGLNVGLGHDSAEGNNSCDMFEVMKFTSLIQRATKRDGSLGQAREILRMACVNGSRGLQIDAGQLTPGRKADVILIDTINQMFTPLMPGSKDQLYNHLVFAANGSCVDTVIVNGSIIYENRVFNTIDEREVLQKANSCFRAVVERMGGAASSRPTATP